jgi:hypothetical protein
MTTITQSSPLHMRQLRCASNRLLAALQREHPHIIASLTTVKEQPQ